MKNHIFPTIREFFFSCQPLRSLTPPRPKLFIFFASFFFFQENFLFALWFRLLNLFLLVVRPQKKTFFVCLSISDKKNVWWASIISGHVSNLLTFSTWLDCMTNWQVDLIKSQYNLVKEITVFEGTPPLL